MTVKKWAKGERRGAAAITILVLLGLMFVALVFCVDLARIQLAELELQCATDTATRAGAEAMSRGVGSVSDLATFEQNVIDEVVMVANLNSAGGNSVTIAPDEIQFGDAVADANGAFTFSASANGGLEVGSNSLNVATNLDQFPVVFGGFVGTDNVDLAGAASAVIRDRDIVLVLDRTTSMLNPDAGTIPIASYPRNLKIVEDLLYGPNDQVNQGALAPDAKRVEFVTNGTSYELTRMQALKLAVLKFREEIDNSRGQERLGLATYHRFGNTPAQAQAGGQVSDGNAFDVTSNSFFNGNPTAPGALQTASEAFKRIIGYSSNVNIDATDSTPPVFTPGDNSTIDGQTNTEARQGLVGLPHEKYASALETAASGYPNFDHSYLSMRYGAATHITRGMLAAETVLFGPGQRDFATPVMIVMTDGRENSGSDAETTADALMALHPEMQIYTVTFGSNPNLTDQPLMQRIAATGNGEHFHAANVQDLVVVFQDLARSAGVGLIE